MNTCGRTLQSAGFDFWQVEIQATDRANLDAYMRD